jgi:hypothetical protein
MSTTADSSTESDSPSEGESSLLVDAEPERALFVQMLTRDIELIPAIMDLLDNSIDGARAHQASAPRDGFWVDLDLRGGEFRISDNCGGIPLDVAQKYAFKFGRPHEYKGTQRSVGQFGVGMKRALFKLGNRFAIDSRTSNTAFEMEVDVAKWMNISKAAWTFEMSKASREYDPKTRGVGTSIFVSELHNSVREDLGNSSFVALLKEQVRFRHQEAISEGILIRLNGIELSGLTQQLLSGPEFAPINRTFVASSGQGDVSVRIIAGITTLERREYGIDEGNAENFRGGGDAGWWIFCNDRLLLMRERTRLTGWGDNLPNYHPQYRRFRGYAFLNAASTEALPWNTTKTGIDEESRVWRHVQSQLKLAGAEVVSVINRLKIEESSATGDAEMPIYTAASRASLTSTKALADNEHFRVPPAPVVKRNPRLKPRTQKMQYLVPLAQYQQVAEHMKTNTMAEVGRRTFEYYFNSEVEDE